MVSGDLPTYPSRGTRRFLDARWLARLQQDGLALFLPGAPEPPAEFRQGLLEFNQGQYWQCHETLERLWLPAPYPWRLFYHALIKAAAGMLHLQRHNRRGATLKLHDATITLAPFGPIFMGVDVARLQRDLCERLKALATTATGDWQGIDQLPAVQIHTFDQ